MCPNQDNLRVLAEQFVSDLLDVGPVLMEDCIDDMVLKHGAKIPGSTPEAKRQKLEDWANFAPTGQKKYLRWMVKQFVDGHTEWSHRDLDLARDAMMDFEHYITMPAFQGSRDIQAYDLKSLVAATSASRGLTSKADRLRGRKTTAASVISQHGDFELLGFKDGQSTAAECWRAYNPGNPNWDGDPHTPEDPEYNQGREPYQVDNLWCTRNPERGAGYIKNSPSKTFYIVRKGGWPFCAAVLSDSGSQIQDLHNRQISVGVAEQVYPLFKPVLDEYAKNGWSIGSSATELFGTIRIVRGEIQPGETIKGADLSGSSLTSLPDNLTVTGNLNLSNTRITRLPNGLKVKGDLNISGTQVTELPANLAVEGSLNLSCTGITSLSQNMSIGTLDISNTAISQIPDTLEVKSKLKIQGTPIVHLPRTLKLGKGAIVEYSAPLTKQEIKNFFFWLREHDLKARFLQREENKSLATIEQKEAAWQALVPKVQAHFQVDTTVDKAVASLFKPVDARR